MKTRILGAIAATSLLISAHSHAALIGVFGDSTAEAIDVATGLGHTAEVVTDFSDLSSYDLVWGLNDSNNSHLGQLTGNQASFDSFVMGGGVFMYHDRFVTDGNDVLAGADNFTFTRDLDSEITVMGPGGLSGGSIDNTTLDNGNFSNHGFVDATSIDRLFTGVLSTADMNELVDFHYSYGLGSVYYSAIPLDFYLGGATAFADPYAPAVLAYALTLSDGSANAIPEPNALSLFVASLLVFSGVRRKRA